MTKKETNSGSEETLENYYKLSIQVSLNGLSFCILDTIGQTIPLSKRVDFGKELSPYEVQKELKALINDYQIQKYGFSDVIIIHRNNLYSLVPKALFNKEDLANYLKFNVKMLANDLLEYDEISHSDMVSVYVPFVNLNNYIYELFGAFEFKHHSTILLEALLKSHSGNKDTVCYVHVDMQQMDIVVLSNRSLVLFNSFHFTSKEDFIYYLLFTLEQLKLDPEQIKVRLFGTIEEEDECYEICYEYIQNIAIYIPEGDFADLEPDEIERVDFTVINAL